MWAISIVEGHPIADHPPSLEAVGDFFEVDRSLLEQPERRSLKVYPLSGFWARRQPDLQEGRAHLVDVIMRWITHSTGKKNGR